MTTWTSDELKRIGEAEELELAAQKADGGLRKAVTIWVVRVDDDLYVRSYKGPSSHWFRGVQVRHAGHIRAGGVSQAVDFIEETDPAINDQVDAAYRAKYQHYPQYVPPMLSPEVRATTIRLAPAQRNSQ